MNFDQNINNYISENLSKSTYTRTDYFNDKTHELLDKAMNGEVPNTVGTRSSLRKSIRRSIAKSLGYKFGELGSSKVSGIPSRKERRQKAKESGVPFEPVYNY